MNIFKTLITFLLLFSATTAYSLSIYVTRSGDSFDGKCDSHCSLREAIQLANETPGHDHIYLEQRFPLTYILSRTPPYVNGEFVDDDRNKVGDLDILDDVTIEGATFADVTAIMAEHGSRSIEYHSGSSRLLNVTINGRGVTNHATLEMRNSHVHNGYNKWRGGAIANYGTLTISSAVISGSYVFAGADQIAEGGGIYNEGLLTIRDAEVRNNAASGSRNGFNMGGGLFNRGQADIRRTLFTGNSLGGDHGNGLAILNADGGSMKLVSSTISGNKGSYRPVGFGAAVANGDPLYISQGEMKLTNVTIAHNEARGFFSAGKTYIKNSIIAKNSLRSSSTISNCYNYGGNFTTYGFLLGMDQTGNCVSDLPIIDDSLTQITTLLQIRPSNIKYSGPTHGHTLLIGSLAIDAGGFDCPALDQITSPAPIDGDNDSIAGCDLGALEYKPDPIE